MQLEFVYKSLCNPKGESVKSSQHLGALSSTCIKKIAFKLLFQIAVYHLNNTFQVWDEPSVTERCCERLVLYIDSQTHTDSPFLSSLATWPWANQPNCQNLSSLSRLLEPTPGIEKCHPYCHLDFTHTVEMEMRAFFFITWSQNQTLSSLGMWVKEPWISLSQHQTWKSFDKDKPKISNSMA